MYREIKITADGSHTIAIPEWNVTYHSHHGAVQESMHVFIHAGLHHVWNIFPSQTIHILEIGWGTGLNGLLSMREAIIQQKGLYYTAIEKFPLIPEEAAQINYGRILSMEEEFKQVYKCEWEKAITLHPLFTLTKNQLSLPSAIQVAPVHCIYFDAFSPEVQPELWTRDLFSHLYRLLLPGGILVTYCSKSNVRKAMSAAGFSVHKIPGPYGKREMVRAVRNLFAADSQI
jgi:tRNA U34 5-methylaminomethyl-2-thiouridine-forming methyltransferase MnmC